METIEILDQLFDKKILKVLKLFIVDKEKEFYLREIAKETRVSVATCFRIVNKLVELEVIKQIKIKKFKLYKFNDNDITKFLETFLKEEKQILNIFVKRVVQISGVESVMLHGKESRDKANVLIIGENIDSNELKRISAEIKEKYKFNVAALALTREQYQQMTAMGLYSGEKRILFRR
ncbi:hypothetical protein HQ529_00125 [Candidatus Woesearchaeota archaeon]|nr:hypothetical protein [Candidatus Woesearchaeota archaeon]